MPAYKVNDTNLYFLKTNHIKNTQSSPQKGKNIDYEDFGEVPEARSQIGNDASKLRIVVVEPLSKKQSTDDVHGAVGNYW